MEYAVLLYGDEAEAGEWATATPEEIATVFEAHERFAETVMAEGGAVVDGAELEPPGTARSLRWTGGRVEAVDGPFAETTEQIGGLYVIEAPDLDQALEWCRLLPHDSEVRPTVVVEGTAGPETDGSGVPDVETDGGTTDGSPRDDVAAVPAVRAMALLYGDEEPWARATEAERAETYGEHGRFVQAVLDAGGAVLGGRELAHSATATSLRCRAGEWSITDGPFVEATEQLTGWYDLGAPDQATLEVLLRGLTGGTTEIRPIAG